MHQASGSKLAHKADILTVSPASAGGRFQIRVYNDALIHASDWELLGVEGVSIMLERCGNTAAVSSAAME